MFLHQLYLCISLDVLVISDIHYAMDSLCETNSLIGSYGCDSSQLLMDSAFKKMHEIDPNPDAVFILGDDLSHGYKEIQVKKKSISEVFDTIHTYFSNTSVIHAIGNNDGLWISQNEREKTDCLAYLYEFWINSSWKAYKFLESGYYNLKIQDYSLIVLSSFEFLMDTPASHEQLQWLAAQLNELEGYAIILTHIPPVNSLFNGAERLWADKNLESFKKIVIEKKNQIIGIFSGHLHKGILGMSGQVPVYINPGISPVYHSNPAFRKYSISHEHIDYTEYVLDLTTSIWEKSYTFSEIFGNLSNITGIIELFENNSNYVDDYIRFSKGFSKANSMSMEKIWKATYNTTFSDNSELSRRLVVCSLQDLLFTEFLECTGKDKN